MVLGGCFYYKDLLGVNAIAMGIIVKNLLKFQKSLRKPR